MKYYSLVKDSKPSKIQVKLINGTSSYIHNMHYKNLLNKYIIDNCFKFPSKTKHKNDYIRLDNFDIHPMNNLVSSRFYEKMNLVSNSILNEENTIKIELNKKQVFYLFLPYYISPEIEIRRFKSILDTNKFNEMLKEYEVKNNKYPTIISCPVLTENLHPMLVSEDFKNAYEQTDLDCFEFQIMYDTERPNLTSEELYIEENQIDVNDHSRLFEFVKDNLTYEEGLSLLDDEGEYAIMYKEFAVRGHKDFPDGLVYHQTYIGDYYRHNVFGVYFIPDEFKQVKWTLMKSKK